jgi:hypothetical protein
MSTLYQYADVFASSLAWAWLSQREAEGGTLCESKKYFRHSDFSEIPDGMRIVVRVALEKDEDVKRCNAVLHHGPGHQSKTRCELVDEHEVHECHYGVYDQLAQWRGDEACTGFFDDPPLGVDDA